MAEKLHLSVTVPATAPGFKRNDIKQAVHFDWALNAIAIFSTLDTEYISEYNVK